MQLVKKRRRGHSITASHLNFIKPHMPLRRCKRRMLCIHQHVNRMGWHHPVNQNTAKIQQMLNRVHRQPRPRSNIDILVMQIVRGFVQRFPMGQAVNPIKMEKPPELNTAQQRHKINRFCAPIHIGNDLIGKRPHRNHFISRPDRPPTHATPENIIAQLIAPQKFAVRCREPFRRVFIPRALRLEPVEIHMPRACNDDEHRNIAHVHLGNPIHTEFHTALERGLQIKPGANGNKHINRIPGPQIARKTEHPLQRLNRTRRPCKNRRRLRAFCGLPLATFIPSNAIYNFSLHSGISHCVLSSNN